MLSRPGTRVWMALMAVTCVTTWGLSQHAVGAKVAVAGTFALAAFKTRLVLLHFMELRHAPLPLRLAFEAWVVAAVSAILGFYLRSAA